jgi:hypothetical protein
VVLEGPLLVPGDGLPDLGQAHLLLFLGGELRPLPAAVQTDALRLRQEVPDVRAVPACPPDREGALRRPVSLHLLVPAAGQDQLDRDLEGSIEGLDSSRLGALK